MPEDFHEDAPMDPLAEWQCRAGVPQMAKANSAKSRVFQHGLEAVRDGGSVQRRADFGGEDESCLPPALTRKWALLFLSRAMTTRAEIEICGTVGVRWLRCACT